MQVVLSVPRPGFSSRFPASAHPLGPRIHPRNRRPASPRPVCKSLNTFPPFSTPLPLSSSRSLARSRVTMTYYSRHIPVSMMSSRSREFFGRVGVVEGERWGGGGKKRKYACFVFRLCDAGFIIFFFFYHFQMEEIFKILENLREKLRSWRHMY